MSNKTRLIFVVNVDWFFLSHRLPIAKEAKKFGFEVIVVGSDTGRAKEIENYGIKFIKVPFSRSGVNPIFELVNLFKLFKIYFFLKPDIVHHITLKPVIYGSIIAKLLNIKNIVNAVSGLGYNFTEGRVNIISRIMLFLMHFAFNNKLSIIFQNQDDFQELTKLNVISPLNKIYFIKGSGVNLDQFYPAKFPVFDKVRILLSSRMLWDKGVKELYEVSLLLKSRYSKKIQFILAGMADEDNKAGVPVSFMNHWQDGEYVKWIGFQSEMIDVYKNSHIVILPSYREGIPKSLIEACATGRAIITTEAIGCKDCVDESINGLKVPIKNVQALANAIEFLVKNPNRIIEMGKASRLKAEKEFDINLVVKTHLAIYNQYI